MGGGSLSAMCASWSSMRGCPACGHPSCVGGVSSLYMGGASSSMGDPSCPCMHGGSCL